MIKNFDIIVYHADCHDGSCAAFLASRVYPDAVLHPASHGDPVPDWHAKRILMVDFLYPRPVMERLRDQNAFIHVLDHHQSACRAFADFDGQNRVLLTLNTAHSGARLM